MSHIKLLAAPCRQEPREERVGVRHYLFDDRVRSLEGELQKLLVVFEGEKQVLSRMPMHHRLLKLGHHDLQSLVYYLRRF